MLAIKVQEQSMMVSTPSSNLLDNLYPQEGAALEILNHIFLL